MWNRRFLTGAICLFSGLVWLGTAEAGPGWTGFSSLCFDLNEKFPGFSQGGDIEVRLDEMDVSVRCNNTQNGQESCHAGTGNGGGITYEFPVQEAGAGKDKGRAVSNGCIPMTIFDKHDDNPDHQHICHPFNNQWKEEVLGTATATRIVVDWKLYGCKDKDRDATGDCTVPNLISEGNQECYWTGSFDLDSCEPTHNASFDCPIDNQNNTKGNK